MTVPSSEFGSRAGPTALRMILGAHLRRLREREGITRSAAGWEIRASESKISRLELGRVSFKMRDVEDLLNFYNLDDPEERDQLLELAKDSNKPGWWHRFGDVLPSWFQSYLGLEATASLIRTYEIQFVPGLLQTPDYARAVVMLGYAKSSDREIQHRVDLRTARQEVLTQKRPPRLWTVVDEAALLRPIGGKAVMREQIERLIEFCEHPHIQIQIIRLEAGGHAAAGGSFTMLRFPEQELPDLIYIEHLTSALYLDKPDDVDSYTASMERLCVQAEQPRSTPGILREILEKHYS